MRIFLAILASITLLSSKAQLYLPASHLGFVQGRPFPDYPSADTNGLNQKWHFSKYASLSAGYAFYPGGAAAYAGGQFFLSAPVGLQLSRALTNNLYAFTGVSVAPVVFSFNSLYTTPMSNASYPGYNPSKPYGFGLNSRVEMGLMYVNDARTFSISGSVGVDRSGYPVYAPTRVNTKRQ
jgi:hypothetical protein